MQPGVSPKPKAAFGFGLNLDPRNGPCLFKLGNVLAAMERPREAARDAYDRTIELDPKNAEAHSGHAVVLHQLGRLEDAVAAYRIALDLAGDHPSADRTRVLLGHALMESGHVEDAVAEIHTAYAESDAYEEEVCGCAIDLYRRGHTDRALVLLHRFIENDRESPRVAAMVALFEAVLSPTDGALERIEGLLREGDLPREVERSLRFGIGRLYDRADRFDDAFAHIAVGNQLFGRRLRCRRPPRVCRQLLHHVQFSKERIEALPRTEIASELLVFIVGMPCSGTMFVEQILGSHPKIHGADELSDIEDMVRSLPESVGAVEPFPVCLSAVTSALATQLATNYLAKLERLGRGASRVTDKMPLNFLYLGLITCLYSARPHCPLRARPTRLRPFQITFRISRRSRSATAPISTTSARSTTSTGA